MGPLIEHPTKERAVAVADRGTQRRLLASNFPLAAEGDPGPALKGQVPMADAEGLAILNGLARVEVDNQVFGVSEGAKNANELRLRPG